MHIGFATQDPYSDYWLIVNHGAHERAAALGVTITTTSATDLAQQIAVIETFIRQRVDALLLGPVAASGLGAAIARAQAAGIPVIVVAAEVRDSAVTCTVRSDHGQGAELAAAYVVEQLEGAGEVAHIVGPSRLQDNVDRAEGVRRCLGKHPGIRLVFERESPDWRGASGAALMREALIRHPELRGVCVANDTLALGALEAIDEAGRTGQIAVTGFDATPDALVAIAEGRLSGTVRQSMRDIGRTGVEMAYRAVRGEPVPQLVATDISLVTSVNLLGAALDSVYLLPSVLRDVVRQGEALARAQDQVIAAQQAALAELSTPLIPLSDEVLVMPLIGAVDSRRAQQVMETLLVGISEQGARTVILDITGVLVVDTQVADSLLRAAQAVKLVGGQVILTGIRPEVAQTLVGLGADLSGITTLATLKRGIAFVTRGS
jgi:ABC-type sugar transport system substrate-binding protein/anti-anti-sigma regulatory factor